MAAAATPSQVHINPGQFDDEVTVLFVTDAHASSQPALPKTKPYVEWGYSASLDSASKVTGWGKHYIPYEGKPAWNGWIWTARLHYLKRNTTVYFKVCSGEGECTETFGFNSQPSADAYPFKMLMYADLGMECVKEQSGGNGCGNQTISAMAAEVEEGGVNVMVDAGDIAYISNDYSVSGDGSSSRYSSANESVFDAYFNQIQPFAARAITVVCPGNHEHYNNFTGYRSRFAMPGPEEAQSLWSSSVVGPVRFVMWSSEHPTLAEGQQQHQFIEAELQKADALRRSNSSAPQWIVVGMHRPFYCSTSDPSDCVDGAKSYRDDLEELLRKYHVDIGVFGHLHNAEVTFPAFGGAAAQTHYDNASDPVHHILGAAGDIEGLSYEWMSPQPDWSAFRRTVLSFGRFTFVSPTEVRFELVASQNGSTVFSYIMTRDRS